MHDVGTRKYFKGLNDLLEIAQSSFLREWTLFLHKFVESSAVAILINEVEVIGSFKHVNVFDDVGTTLESGQDINLVHSTLFQFWNLPELFSLHNFNCNFLFCDKVDCLVYFRIHALTQLFFEFIVFNYLPHQ